MFRPRALSHETKKNIFHWGMEIMVVVVGVLLALWTQEWVEGRREKAEHQRAMSALNREVKIAQILSAKPVMVDACVTAQIDRIMDLLKEGGREWPGVVAPESQFFGDRMAAPIIYPTDFFSTEPYTRAREIGALDDFSGERQLAYDEMFFAMRRLDQIHTRIEQAIASLRPLAMAQQLDPATRVEMLQQLAMFDRMRISGLFQARQMVKTAAQVGQSVHENDGFLLDKYLRYEKLAEQYGGCIDEFDWTTGNAAPN